MPGGGIFDMFKAVVRTIYTEVSPLSRDRKKALG
jgi:hypothetical protein